MVIEIDPLVGQTSWPQMSFALVRLETTSAEGFRMSEVHSDLPPENSSNLRKRGARATSQVAAPRDRIV